VGGDDDAMSAAARRRRIVVTGDETRDRGCELIGERGALGRGTEADLGVKRQRRQPFAGPVGSARQVANLADDACGKTHEVAGGEAVGDPFWIARRPAERGRGDDVRGGRRQVQPLGQPSPAAFFDHAHEPVGLERAQVVVDLLASEANAGCEAGCRTRLGQLGEKACSHWVERHHRGARVGDDLDIEHPRIPALTNNLVKLPCDTGRMPTFVALLRGINVGGKTMISMPALRSMLAAMGFEDVTTYIQSGNLVLSSSTGDAGELAVAIEERIAETFGLSTAVLMRTPAELTEIAGSNPFLGRETDPLKLHVVFLSDTPSATALKELDPKRSPPDEFSVRGREIYLHLPNGFGRSKLTIDYFEKRLGVRATARNWRTVNKLIELSEG
jgi:uncharacterized protein (DUF1697 family)